ncbi:hypothetical protein Q3P06_01585 [Ralstonia pseudosolanacearum]|uniref:hypothetical protein n=1 Tax=Ralstonia pseudosolanacearum TaxID=1310165 RepID=UPI0026762F3B|nr:hypothetical protein [Ralstonia pseudosolanacearum]MDO3510593.1 hypothetical protein [Ralstonia pseudosolanacearum]MDO3629614.1 hypothetical protein [Ralstonia pseudosolanacearum]
MIDFLLVEELRELPDIAGLVRFPTQYTGLQRANGIGALPYKRGRPIQAAAVAEMGA